MHSFHEKWNNEFNSNRFFDYILTARNWNGLCWCRFHLMNMLKLNVFFSERDLSIGRYKQSEHVYKAKQKLRINSVDNFRIFLCWSSLSVFR